MSETWKCTVFVLLPLVTHPSIFSTPLSLSPLFHLIFVRCRPGFSPCARWPCRSGVIDFVIGTLRDAELPKERTTRVCRRVGKYASRMERECNLIEREKGFWRLPLPLRFPRIKTAPYLTTAASRFVSVHAIPSRVYEPPECADPFQNDRLNSFSGTNKTTLNADVVNEIWILSIVHETSLSYTFARISYILPSS